MTTNRTTRGAIISSILALILCFAMLLGSTFAWFTDSASSSGNKIVSGTLDVDFELLDKDTGVWNSLKDTSASIFNYDKWEPGYTEVKILKVENLGTLALKWKAVFTSEKDLSALADVIDVYVLPYGVLDDAAAASLAYPADLTGYTCVGSLASYLNTIETSTYGNLEAGESAYLGIALQMKGDAGNEYQGLDLCGSFDLTIVAAQRMSESDSFGTSYDSGATYPNISLKVPVSNSASNDLLFNTKSMNVKTEAGVDFGGASEATLKHTEPRVENDTVILDEVEFYDENNNVIDLSANDKAILVSLYVGDYFSEGDYVDVYHDDVLVASALTVDANGYVSYEALHFCEITVKENTDPRPIVVTSEEELIAALETAELGSLIDASGVVISGKSSISLKGGFTIIGLTIEAPNNALIRFENADVTGAVATFEDCKFICTESFPSKITMGSDTCSAVFTDCLFSGAYYISFANQTNATAEYNNCSFRLSVNGSGMHGFVNCMGGTQTFNGCDFDYTSGTTMGSNQYVKYNAVNSYSERYSTSVILSGCSFTNCGTQRYGSNSTLVVK